MHHQRSTPNKTHIHTPAHTRTHLLPPTGLQLAPHLGVPGRLEGKRFGAPAMVRIDKGLVRKLVGYITCTLGGKVVADRRVIKQDVYTKTLDAPGRDVCLHAPGCAPLGLDGLVSQARPLRQLALLLLLVPGWGRVWLCVCMVRR